MYVDYPERWPDLLPTVMQNLTSPEQQRIHGALYCLRIIARKYEFKDEVCVHMSRGGVCMCLCMRMCAVAFECV